MKLTQRRIDLLECPAGKKDALVFDDEQKGLGVRVTASGAKSYLAQYALAGAKRRIPLGSCGAISLAAAREATKAILGDVAKGRDPAAERKEAGLKAKREALTLDGLIEQWAALHLSGKRANYSAAAVSALRRTFARRLEAPAADLDRAAAVRALDDLAKNGKVQMAASTARYGGALYGWAKRRGIVAVNPFEGVPIAPLTRRDRVLSDEEIRLIWGATEEPGTFNAIVRALLLTGQRREEVTGLTWAEIDETLSGWTLPAVRSKNGKPHFIPLSEQMRALLRAQPRREGTDLVFPGERGVFSGWSKSKDRLDQRMRRLRLDAPRFAANGGHRPAEARRPARSDRGRSQPRVGKPRRHCRRLSAPSLGRREARRADRLGRACRRDRRGTRGGRERDAADAARRRKATS